MFDCYGDAFKNNITTLHLQQSHKDTLNPARCKRKHHVLECLSPTERQEESATGSIYNGTDQNLVVLVFIQLNRVISK